MAKEKFSKSKDGVMRCTVNHTVTMRLTEEELEKYNRLAFVVCAKDFRGFLKAEMPHPISLLEEKALWPTEEAS